MYISASITKNRQDVLVWERTEHGRDLKVYPAPYYFFVPDKNGEYADIHGNKLKRKDFASFSDFKEEKMRHLSRGEKTYEAGISPEYKVLSKHYFNAEIPKMNIMFYDIEVDYDKEKGFSDIDNPYAPISSIAIQKYWTGETIVLAVPPPNLKGITVDDLPEDIRNGEANIILCKNERELLKLFFIIMEDADIISGWNSAYFDTPYVYERARRVLGENFANKLSLDLAPPPKYREVEMKGVVRKVLDIYGRHSLDYLEVFKKFEVVERPSYTLDAISEEVLPHFKKLDIEESLYDLYRNDFPHFIRYNIRDAEVLKGFEDKLGYMQLAVQRANMACGLVTNILGTVKLAELDIVNYCHYTLKRRVPDAVIGEPSGEKFTGALVLPPKVGLHENVGSIDIASLYPSAIRSGNYSPDTIIGQFFETHHAFTAIQDESEQLLVFMYENGESDTRSAKEWKKWIVENKYSLSGYGTIFSMEKQGFLPAILTEWFADRKKFKAEMKVCGKAMDDHIKNGGSKTDPEYLKLKERKAYCDRVQYIKKIQLNSMYGCLGNAYFMFFDRRLAESTTRTGRAVLMHMVRKTAEVLDGAYAYPSKSTIYSDTDSCYFLTNVETTAEAKDVCAKVYAEVNASFPEFMRQAFGCQEGYDNLISAEVDVIATKAIFIKPKHYLMHVVSQEGMDKDEMKVMGVQLKKTTIPKPISKKLVSTIEAFLKGTGWRETSQDFVDFKLKLLNAQNIMDIGLPKGVKQVAEYTAEYEANNKAKLPGHVSAAIFYNLCLDAYGDVENFKITSGMKIKTFYLKKKFGRFKSIALPTDLKHPPKWFTEHFSDIIDRDAQVLRLVDKPLETILGAIGKYVPSPMTILYEDVVEY